MAVIPMNCGEEGIALKFKLLLSGAALVISSSIVPLVGQTTAYADSTTGGSERFANVLVSATGSTGNTINEGNTSRNVGVSSDGTIYVVYSGTNGIYVARSTDDGESFTQHTLVSADTNVQPEINVDSDGIVYVAWVTLDGDIMVSRSVDDGATFSSPVQAGTGSSTVHIATDANYVYLITPDGEQLHYSTDGGLTFQATTLSNTSYVYSDVHVDPANRDVIVQEDNPNIKYYISTDHGQSFGSEIDPSGAQVYYSVGDVSAGSSGDFLYISGEGSTSYKIDLNNSDVNTNTTALDFPDDEAEQGRSISTDGYGNVVTGYSDGTDVYFAVSHDFGSTFADPVEVTTGTEAKASINTTNGDVLYVYENTSGQIYLNVYSNELIGYEPNLSTSALTFGAEPVGVSSQPQPITITNTSTDPLIISNVSTTGPFSASGGVGTLQPGDSTQIQVSFDPTTTGTQTGTLEIYSNAPGSPRVINLSSTNVAALSVGSVEINGSTITSNTVQGTVGDSLSGTIAASGGTAPYEYAVIGTLPDGLSIDPSTGDISGTPSTAGTSSATIQVTDSSGLTADIPLTFDITSATASTVYWSFGNTNVVSGGSDSVTGVVYDVYGVPVSNTSVDLSGTIGSWTGSQSTDESVYTDPSGTFTATWTAPMVTKTTQATVTASVYGTSETFTSPTITIAPPPTFSISTLPSAKEGANYSQSIAMSGGFAPYTYSVASGSLPLGMSLDASTGIISGIPETTGSSTFVVKATDAEGNVATQSLTIDVVVPDLNTAGVAPGSVVGTTSIVAKVPDGDHLAYVLGNSATSTLPGVGDPAPSGTIPYTSGANIVVSAGQYLDVYELDGNNKVVAFDEYPLTSADIGANAPDLTNASVSTGSVAGTTSITAKLSYGDHLAYVLGDSAISALPTAGSPAPSGAIPYTSGGNIVASAGQYLDVYELDENNKVVAFDEYPLTSVDIAVAGPQHNNGGSGSATNSDSGTTGSGEGYFLPTVQAQQTVGTGATTVQQIFGNTTVNVQVPAGALPKQEQITITTGTPTQVQTHQFTGMTAGNTPLLVGVYFSGNTTNLPVTVTVTQANIPSDARVYNLIPGVGYMPIKAQVTEGKMVVSLNGSSNLAIVQVSSNQQAITLGTHIAVVPSVKRGTEGNQTTYLPIWYVMNELNSVGIKSTWDGKQWNVMTDNHVATNQKSAKGTTGITVNGSEVIQNVKKLVSVDPNSGKKTTYMPLSILEKLMSHLGVQNAWDGVTWSLTDASASTTDTDTSSK